MTHQTEIIKTGHHTETHFSLGRDGDSKIYVNVRHYYQDELIGAGDILISQPEWNLINTNLERNTLRFYRCPECGEIVTEDEIAEDCAEGGYGCCLCKYGNGSRLLVEYVPYELEPESLLELSRGEIELIKIFRRLCDE